jgi:hypothetical protein
MTIKDLMLELGKYNLDTEIDFALRSGSESNNFNYHYDLKIIEGKTLIHEDNLLSFTNDILHKE